MSICSLSYRPDYDEIDLPVFTCSARDYVRIKGQVQGDGDPSCFSNLDDTCIPALQEWCHSLTVSSRERAARNFLTHLKTFGSSVQTYVQGIGEITVEDRTLLREKWESTPAHADDDGSAYGGGWASSDDPYDMPGFAQLAGHGLLSMNKPALKVDAYGEPIGVTPQLTKDFKKVVNDSVVNLKTAFNSGLEEKCRVGAANPQCIGELFERVSGTLFALTPFLIMYCVALRRFGSFRRDFNVELVNPFTRNIASSWQQVFEGDLFAAFERAATHSINKLLKQVEDSAAGGLKDRVKSQAELCLEEARVALEKTLELVRVTMNNEQKEVSRCLAPHVQNQLTDTYLLALEERGPGSVARQKAVFRNSISEQKDEVFEDGADVILERLAAAAEAIGATLQGALADLAQKIEVNLSVLWEDVQDDPNQVRARQEAVVIISEILQQVHFWTEAAQQRAQTH
ncbi:hypothetical protein HWV62_3046 [Athelia sp. TMB]|nr:hypothetical protein HWV62_3046 [Athelia sp. TMB]